MATNRGDVFGDEHLGTLPSPLAVSLRAYRDEGNYQLKLWRACESVELLMRILVLTRIAELHAGGAMSRDLRDDLRDRLWAPTLRHWTRIADRLAHKSLPPSAFFPEASAEFARRLSAFFGSGPSNDTVGSSFLQLRNRLAHGFGLDIDTAGSIFELWEGRIRDYFQNFAWLDAVTFYSRSGDAVISHRGPDAESMQDRKPPDGLRFARPDDVVAVRGAHRVSVWPLIRFGHPNLPDARRALDRPVLEIYSRQSSVEGFHYTPIQSHSADWSVSDPEASACFFEWFPRSDDSRGTASRQVGKAAALVEGDAVSNFGPIVAKEARQLVGRTEALDEVERLVRAAQHPVYWLSGTAGIGKSMVLAAVADRALKAADRSDAGCVVPYRFKRGDARCNRLAFMALTGRTLLGEGDANDSVTMDYDQLRRALLQRIRDTRVFMVFDGLDEIDEVDETFVPDVLVRLAHEFRDNCNVTWLWAGRESSARGSMRRYFKPQLVHDVFRDGLQPLKEEEVRSFLVEQMGPTRYRLLGRDQSTRKKLAELPLTRALVRALDAGGFPPEIEKIIELPYLQASSDVRVLKGGGKRDARTWLVEFSDRILRLESKAKVLSVYSDQVRNRFVEMVSEKSKGLPLYLRFVVQDILRGVIKNLDEDLPDGLQSYYTELLGRNHIGQLAVMLTPLLCLIACAEEPLRREHLLARVRSQQAPLHFGDEEDAEKWLGLSMEGLSPMLRGDGSADTGYTPYHFSLRQHLETSEDTKAQFALAHRWLASQCLPKTVDEGGVFARYAARHGISHLIRCDMVAEAIDLLHRMKLRLPVELGLTPGQLWVFTRRVCKAIGSLRRSIEDRPATDAGGGDRNATARSISVNRLADIVVDAYETGVYSDALVLMMTQHEEEWFDAGGALRARFIGPFNIVAKLAVGEALAESFAHAPADGKARILERIRLMAGSADIDEREAAGYALEGLFLDQPELIEAERCLLESWATYGTPIERMLVGEIVVSLSQRGAPRYLPSEACHAFWQPVWDYHMLDVCDLFAAKGDVPEYARVCPEALHQARKDRIDARERLQRLGGVDDVRARPELCRLVDEYDLLCVNHDALADVPETLGEMLGEPGARRTLAKEVVELLFMHPSWSVTESATTIVRDIVEKDRERLDLLDELLAGTSGNWRVAYGTVDAAFNARDLDEGRTFRAALRRYWNHSNARVRGICLDDLFAWVRLAPMEHREQLVDEFADILGQWMGLAKDFWELEYLFLLCRLLDTEGPSRAMHRFLGDPPAWSRYFVPIGGLPFYKVDRETFLRHIDRLVPSVRP